MSFSVCESGCAGTKMSISCARAVCAPSATTATPQISARLRRPERRSDIPCFPFSPAQVWPSLAVWQGTLPLRHAGFVADQRDVIGVALDHHRQELRHGMRERFIVADAIDAAQLQLRDQRIIDDQPYIRISVHLRRGGSQRIAFEDRLTHLPGYQRR